MGLAGDRDGRGQRKQALSGLFQLGGERYPELAECHNPSSPTKPLPLAVTPHRVRWLEVEIDEWLAGRMSARSVQQ